MKVKYLIPFLILVLVFGFGLNSCSPKSLPEDLEKIKALESSIKIRDGEIKNLTAELGETKEELKVANKQIEEMENANIEIIAEEVPEEENKSVEEIEEDIRDIIEEAIEIDLKGKLVKFNIDNEEWNINISYNSRWASEDRIKREMFEIVSLIAESGFGMLYNLDLIATGSSSGNSHNSFNSIEILSKLYNYEMDYPEWLDITFK